MKYPKPEQKHSSDSQPVIHLKTQNPKVKNDQIRNLWNPH